MSILLPQLLLPAEFDALRSQNDRWLPAIQAICQQHQLPDQPLQFFTEGSSVVVSLAGQYVLKLMPPFWAAEGVREAQVLDWPLFVQQQRSAILVWMRPGFKFWIAFWNKRRTICQQSRAHLLCCIVSRFQVFLTLVIRWSHTHCMKSPRCVFFSRPGVRIYSVH